MDLRPRLASANVLLDGESHDELPLRVLELGGSVTSESDILVKAGALEPNVAMNVGWRVDKTRRYQLIGADITVSSSQEFTNSQLRFYMLHEMFHVLTGSDDVDYTESQTFSVFNYNDVGYITGLIDNAYTSMEEKNNDIIAKRVYINYPVLTEETKNSFVTYTPTDIGTLIALYGDSSTQENRDTYIGLLTDTVNNCKQVFGNQPYFAKGYVVPSTSTEEDDDLVA